MYLYILEEIFKHEYEFKKELKIEKRKVLSFMIFLQLVICLLIKKPLFIIENLGLIHNIDSASMLIFSFQEPDQMTQFLIFL